MKAVAIIGALDTKCDENLYLKKQIEKAGIKALLVDVGMMRDPQEKPDVTADEVARAAGTTVSQMRASTDKSFCLSCMGRGAGKIVRALYDAGKIQGAISIGGGQGTLMGAMVMRELPVGAPKVLLSTIALLKDSDAPFRGIKDTMVMNSQVDVSGLNGMMRLMLKKSAAALCGMVNADLSDEEPEPKLCVGLTMFGVTTPCVTRVRELLEARGYEVLVFHATGAGGPMMESLIRDGRIQGVADITLAEIGHQIVGGSGAGGKDRLFAAGEMGIPQVIVPGALDGINFMPPESMPKRFSNRRFHMHNANLRVIRTSAEENRIFGEAIAEKLNQSGTAPVVLLPLGGLSSNDRADGGDFWDADADAALFDSLQNNLRGDIPCRREPYHINDPAFAQEIVDTLDRLMREKYR